VEDEEYFRYYYTTGVVTGIILNHLWTFFFVYLATAEEKFLTTIFRISIPVEQITEEFWRP